MNPTSSGEDQRVRGRNGVPAERKKIESSRVRFRTWLEKKKGDAQSRKGNEQRSVQQLVSSRGGELNELQVGDLVDGEPGKGKERKGRRRERRVSGEFQREGTV